MRKTPFDCQPERPTRGLKSEEASAGQPGRLQLIGTLAWLSACATPFSAGSDDENPGSSSLVHTPPISSISYTMDWSWLETEPHDDEPGFTVVTNLDYEVRVDSGQLMNHTLQLVPCSAESEFDPLGWLPDLLGKTAWASDGATADPSALPDHVLELFESLETQELGQINVDNTIYCQFHYLVAPTVFGGSSLVMTGEITDANGSTSPLFISTTTAWGELYALDELQQEVSAGPLQLNALLTRSTDSLFDDIDFGTVTDGEERSRAILRNLMNHTQLGLQITPG